MNSPWNDRLGLFRKTLDKIIEHLNFRTIHEYNTIANILESKAMFLRYEADELLRDRTEVQTEDRGFERSGQLIDSGRGRLPTISLE